MFIVHFERQTCNTFISKKCSSLFIYSICLYTLGQIVIVDLVLVLENVLLDLGAVHPRQVVLQVSRDQVCWIGDDVGPHSHMSLLNKSVCVFDSLSHPQPTHHNTDSSSTECSHRNLVFEVGDFGFRC